MAQNLIRLKQLNTTELSGFFASTATNTGAFASLFGTQIVYTTGDQNISGQKRFIESDIQYDYPDYLSPYTNLSLHWRNGPFLKSVFKSVVFTGAWNPNLGGSSTAYSGIGDLTNLPYVYYDTGSFRWKFLYGPDRSLVAQSQVISPTPFSSTVSFPLNNWLDSSSGSINLKFIPNTQHSYTHNLNEKDQLDIIQIGAVATTGGNQTISGVKTFANSGIFSLSGATPLGLPNNPLATVGSGNTYLQLNIQNRATGTDASADLVITANNGTDSTNYINLGINNSGYNNSSFTNGTGYDGYLFIDGGNLDIGTRTPGKIIEFHAGGTTQEKTIARIDESGINILSGTYRVNNIPSNTFTITLTHTSSTPNIGFNYFGMNEMGYSQASLGSRRRIPIAETCQIRKASWSHVVGTTGSPANIYSTGYLINTSSNPPQTGIIFTGIDSSNDTNPANYITNFSTPINVTSGDLIVAALIISGFTIAPLAMRDTVVLYCYN